MKLSRFEQQFPFKISLRKIAESPWLIYFLVDDDAIVYVGKSSEAGLRGRIGSHLQDKTFTAFFTIDNFSSEIDALRIESGFISLLRPKYNTASTEIDISAIGGLINFINKIDNFKKRANPISLSESEYQELESSIIALRDSGLSYQQIAKEVNLSHRQQVARILERARNKKPSDQSVSDWRSKLPDESYKFSYEDRLRRKVKEYKARQRRGELGNKGEATLHRLMVELDKMKQA